MFLVVSNDDGYLSPGIKALTDILRPEVERLAIVAPDRNCSGASHCLTLTRPLYVHEHPNNIYSVDGTPSDCVNLAVTGLFDETPNMVVSGINHGANMGDDVMYSGTVAAAYEGRSLGLPAIAVSNVAHKPKHLADSAKILCDLFLHLQKFPLSPSVFLNVNIPDLPYDEIQGIKTTILGNRNQVGRAFKTTTPRGESVYWIGPAGGIPRQEKMSDFAAISEGFVSVTPLQFDLTSHQQIADVETWLGEFHD